jgi:hypothetical protein
MIPREIYPPVRCDPRALTGEVWLYRGAARPGAEGGGVPLARPCTRRRCCRRTRFCFCYTCQRQRARPSHIALPRGPRLFCAVVYGSSRRLYLPRAFWCLLRGGGGGLRASRAASSQLITNKKGPAGRGGTDAGAGATYLDLRARPTTRALHTNALLPTIPNMLSAPGKPQTSNCRLPPAACHAHRLASLTSLAARLCVPTC